MTEQEAIEYFKTGIEERKKNNMALSTISALELAISALEKQIPKVPNYSGDGYYNGQLVIDTWECPCCGYQYEVDYDDYEYCPKCGQHIDHSTLTEED